MSELRVGAIGDDARWQPLRGRVLWNAWKKTRQPFTECLGGENPAHEVRLGEAGGEKVLARRLVVQGAIAIALVEPLCGVAQQLAHLGIGRASCGERGKISGVAVSLKKKNRR